jgi:ABC-type multidrug transport system fused ATPase/permease subunit
MDNRWCGPVRRLAREEITLLRGGREVWCLVRARDRWGLAAAGVVMAFSSACQVAVALFLGRLIDDVRDGRGAGLAPSTLYRLATFDLAIIAAAYLLREGLHVVRRYLVESTCLRIDKETTVHLVAHLLRMDLGTLSHHKVGALHGRICRNVEGFVRFLRLSFLDFLPAILTGGLALAVTASRAPWLALLMTGVIPLECVSREAIGRLVGYVSQTPFLFAGTIAENIAYGCEPAEPEAIERAARLACLHEEIVAMPGGYQATVAERGQNLSGGQKQRIALARVFLKGPPILILDEATSSLDTISERRVQQALDAARADRTIILVAHRLSTLRQADRVVVFDEGRVVESGTYGELVRGGALFSELVRSAEEDAAANDRSTWRKSA